MKPSRVVFEASGGYEKELLFALIAAGLPASRVNAQQVRHFAKALGRRAKTDPVDAAVLQRFGDQIGRAHDLTPVTNAHLVCRILLEKNTNYAQPTKKSL